MQGKSIVLLGISLLLLGSAAWIRLQVESPVPFEERIGIHSAPLSTQESKQASPSSPQKKPFEQIHPTPASSSSMNSNPALAHSRQLIPNSTGTPSPIQLLDRKGKISPVPSPSASQHLDLKTLHSQAIVVDAHVETPLLLTERRAKLAKNPYGQVDLARLKQGGVDVIFFSIFVNPWRYRKVAKLRADFIIKTLKREIQAHSKDIELAYSYADIQRIVSQKKIAALMGMEGGDPLGSSLKNVDYFYKQGIRYLSPTWSTHTLLGDSASQPPRWKGLSPFGKQVIKRMNELGMLVDVSHISDAAFYDVLKISNQPVIASHSGVRSVRTHPRNLSPDMLKLLASKGGVVGIYFYPPYIDNNRRSTLKKVVDHIDAAVKLVGAQHVGLGSDFDGLDTPPPVGLENAAYFPAITAELRKRKYSDADIQQILGGSFMRVFQQVLR